MVSLGGTEHAINLNMSTSTVVLMNVIMIVAFVLVEFAILAHDTELSSLKRYVQQLQESEERARKEAKDAKVAAGQEDMQAERQRAMSPVFPSKRAVSPVFPSKRAQAQATPHKAGTTMVMIDEDTKVIEGCWEFDWVTGVYGCIDLVFR